VQAFRPAVLLLTRIDHAVRIRRSTQSTRSTPRRSTRRREAARWPASRGRTRAESGGRSSALAGPNVGLPRQAVRVERFAERSRSVVSADSACSVLYVVVAV